MSATESHVSPPLRTLARPAGGTIAYHKMNGRSPTVVFLTGLRSDMTGGKALALEALCVRRGQGFLRFDYSGHGQSSGRFEETAIGDWFRDALMALDSLTAGPLILVGSSLGGWIMLLVAAKRPDRIKGLVGIAAAPDFTEDLMWRNFSAEQRAALTRDGVLYLPSQYDPEPTPVTLALIEDGKKHLLLGRTIPFDGPVRLIHGFADPDVPWQTSMRIQACLTSRDVEITLVKGAGHRLSEPHDLERMCDTVAKLCDRLG
jgi:pimeloyl-ACP methyl ester carboxylesterase